MKFFVFSGGIEYKRLQGHCNVPARYVENRRLGIWVSAQRQHYKILQLNKQLDHDRSPEPPEGGDAVVGGTEEQPQNTRRPAPPLTQERVDLLNALGFSWTIRSRDALGESWNQRFQELRQFKQENGHCLVPSRYEKNPELGIWVGTQRTQYRQYMRSREAGQIMTPTTTANTTMNDHRIQELEELGFVWTLRGNDFLPGGESSSSAAATVAAAASAVEIADQVANVAAAAAATAGAVSSLHRHPPNHHGHDPLLVGHHVEPTVLDYHPYHEAMLLRNQHHHHQAMGELDESVHVSGNNNNINDSRGINLGKLY